MGKVAKLEYLATLYSQTVTLKNIQTLLYFLFNFFLGCVGNSIGPIIPNMSRCYQVGEEDILWIFTTEDVGCILGNVFGGLIFRILLQRQRNQNSTGVGKNKRRNYMCRLPSIDSLHMVIIVNSFLRSVLYFMVPYLSSFAPILLLFLVNGILRSISGIGIELAIAMMWGQKDDDGKKMTIVLHIYHCTSSFGSFLFPLILTFVFKRFESGPDQMYIVFLICSCLFLFIQVPFLLIPSPIHKFFTRPEQVPQEEVVVEEEELKEEGDERISQMYSEGDLLSMEDWKKQKVKEEERRRRMNWTTEFSNHVIRLIRNYVEPKEIYSFDTMLCIVCGAVLALNRGVKIGSILVFNTTINHSSSINPVDLGYISSTLSLGFLIGRIVNVIVICFISDILVLSYCFIVCFIISLLGFILGGYVHAMFCIMVIIGFHEAPIGPSLYSLPIAFGVELNEKTYMILRNFSSLGFLVRVFVNLLFRTHIVILVLFVLVSQMFSMVVVLFIPFWKTMKTFLEIRKRRKRERIKEEEDTIMRNDIDDESMYKKIVEQKFFLEE